MKCDRKVFRDESSLRLGFRQALGPHRLLIQLDKYFHEITFKSRLMMAFSLTQSLGMAQLPEFSVETKSESGVSMIIPLT